MEDIEVNYRAATVTDYDGIKILSKDTYGGTDTLLHSVLDWLESDRWFLFVGEIDKTKIVAFTAVQLTDGVQGLNIRCSRVDEEYRCHGIYKGLLRYAMQYVRERLIDVKYVYRLKPADIRVPIGYDIIKERGVVKGFMNCNDETIRSKCDFARVGCQRLSWGEFKNLYVRSSAVKELFVNTTMEVHFDIFDLGCQANWKRLEEREGTRIFLTECEDKDGNTEVMISVIRLEEFFTNEGIPMVAMNVYGVNRDALRCHISRAYLEVCNNFVGARALLSISVEVDVMSECIELLKELFGCDACYVLKIKLLCGDFSRKLEDM